MITIIGAGALGSHVALFLRNVGELEVVDFDRVEQKNILAQFHSKMGLRKNKALALSQSMQGLFGVKVRTVPHRLTKDNWSQILKDADLILDCTDNIAARNLIHEWWDEYAVPVLHGALSADGTFARIVWAEDFTADAEGEDGEATCIDGEHLPFFAMAASLMAGQAQFFLKTGKKMSFQLSPTGIVRLT